jgi:predicted acetyltransferase
VGAVGIDAATAPSHRGMGHIESLARAVYRDRGERGKPVTLCYPNANSLIGFVKAGGHPVGELRTFVLPVDDAWVAQRFHVPRVVASALRRVAFGR